MSFSINGIKSINLDLSNYCNLECPCCDRINYTNLNTTHLDITKLIKVLDTFPNLKQLNTIGNISEPALYKYIKELKVYLLNRCITLYMTTNGTASLTTYKFLQENRYKDDQIIFCVDGSTQEIHQRYRKGSNLKKILTNYNTLTQGKGLQYLLFQHNIEDAKVFKKEYPETIFKIADVQNINPYVKSINDTDNFRYKRFFGKSEIKCDCQEDDYDNINITIDGYIYPCCHIQDTDPGIFKTNLSVYTNPEKISDILRDLNMTMKPKNLKTNMTCFMTCSNFIRTVHTDSIKRN